MSNRTAIVSVILTAIVFSVGFVSRGHCDTPPREDGDPVGFHLHAARVLIASNSVSKGACTAQKQCALTIDLYMSPKGNSPSATCTSGDCYSFTTVLPTDTTNMAKVNSVDWNNQRHPDESYQDEGRPVTGTITLGP